LQGLGQKLAPFSHIHFAEFKIIKSIVSSLVVLVGKARSGLETCTDAIRNGSIAYKKSALDIQPWAVRATVDAPQFFLQLVIHGALELYSFYGTFEAGAQQGLG
jgi:hypothetical protein